MILDDSSLQEQTALFVEQIPCNFKEDALQNKLKVPIFTTSGRDVKKSIMFTHEESHHDICKLEQGPLFPGKLSHFQRDCREFQCI